MKRPGETSHPTKTNIPKRLTTHADIPERITSAKPTFVEQIKSTFRRRKFLIGVVIVVVLALGFTIWLVCDIRENRRLDAESVIFRADRQTVEFDSALKISDFLAGLDGELVDDFAVDTSTLGTHETKFQYRNVKNKVRTMKLNYKVVDTAKPVIYGQNAYTVEIGYDGDLTDLMLSGDNADDHPTREISGKYNLQKTGNYTLEYIITDASGNRTSQPFVLRVVKPSAGSSGSSNTSSNTNNGIPISEIINQYKNGNTEIGIDVSSWQGAIDWKKVRAAGVEFAIIRVGYQAEYGGEYVLDENFAANIGGALDIGLPVGVYFYSCADSLDEARRQADWVLEQVGDRPLALGITFDWEEWHDFNRAGMSFSTLQKVADTFLSTVEATGYQGMLYGSKNYLDKFWQRNTRAVWLAQYYDRPTYAQPFQIWQLTDTGTVPGISSYVDLDVRYK